ncbi:MAG: preprotein translocase subunit YajC [Thermoguttaceae bacterium]
MMLTSRVWTYLALLADGEPAAPGGASWGMAQTVLFLWLPIGLLFYWLLIMPQRRDQRKRQDLLSNLKESDRVLTAGGVYGVVTNVNRERGQATLKVDENNNTKIRVSLGAITQVLTDEASSESPSK